MLVAHEKSPYFVYPAIIVVQTIYSLLYLAQILSYFSHKKANNSNLLLALNVLLKKGLKNTTFLLSKVAILSRFKLYLDIKKPSIIVFQLLKALVNKIFSDYLCLDCSTR